MSDTYNPSDPLQAAFLGDLAAGEGNAGPLQGYGYVDLSDYPAGIYGFPLWPGSTDTPTGQITHAAGPFQFQPGTWNAIAAQHGLNFQNPGDQAAGAWYLADQTYAAKTGGSLESALGGGLWSSIQNALAGVWTSITSDNPPVAGSSPSGGAGGSPTPAGGAAQPAAKGGGFFAPLETWLTNIAGSSVFVIVGIVLVMGALVIFANDTGVTEKVARLAASEG